MAWTTMNLAGGWINLGSLPRATFDALYAEGPDVIIGGVFSPSGTAVPVKGGYRVRGQGRLEWGRPSSSAGVMAEWPRKPTDSPLVHPREVALDSPEDRLAGTSPEDQQRSRGRDAHARYAWREAYEALRDAGTMGRLEPSDLERLGEAAWWTGHLAESIGAREQAYAARVVDAPRAAALLAIELARNYYSKGDVSVGGAWLVRAERLLRDQSPCLEEGYLARMQTVVAFEVRHDNRAALEYARRALDLATTFGDRDLMAIALHDQGRIMVSLGDVAAGHALMDEATVAALSGELNPFATAVIYCNTIDTCVSVGDYVRAREWTEGAKRWCERQAIAGFPGMCRVHRAGILRLRGAWIEAADEAKRASEELREFNARYYAAALEELGTIRLREGDLMGAAEAFRQTRELGREPEPGQSLLYLAEGKPGAALTAIRRALDDPSLDPPHRARLLPAWVEIAVAADDLTGAVTAAEELGTIARAYGTAALEASATQARGVVTLARGDAQAAAVELRRAAHLWQDANCPYEAARARLTLASAYEGTGDTEASCLELETARSVFERLGAQLDLRRARARLDSLRANSATALERVTRTFMFTDIVGSTGLIEAIGDEAWTDLRAWHDRTLRSLITRHGGEEVDHAGDGFFVAFATPDSAVACAVAIQRTLAEHRRSHGFAPKVRIGLHAALATRRGEGFEGKGVHAAARIAAVAAGDEILASVSTLSDTTAVSRSAARSIRLAGLNEPVEVVTVDWRA